MKRKAIQAGILGTDKITKILPSKRSVLAARQKAAPKTKIDEAMKTTTSITSINKAHLEAKKKPSQAKIPAATYLVQPPRKVLTR